MSLSRRVAEAMASGAVDRLPRLTRHAPPQFARSLLEVYFGYRDQILRFRETEGARWSVEDRIAAASVLSKVDEAIRDTWEWLQRVAESGGHGLPVSAGFDLDAVRASLGLPADLLATRSRHGVPAEAEPDARDAAFAATAEAEPRAEAGASSGGPSAGRRASEVRTAAIHPAPFLPHTEGNSSNPLNYKGIHYAQSNLGWFLRRWLAWLLRNRRPSPGNIEVFAC